MARQTKKLVDEAHSLGIDVDGRWGDETIQEKIDEANAAQAAAAKEGQGDAEDGGDFTGDRADDVDQDEDGGGALDSDNRARDLAIARAALTSPMFAATFAASSVYGSLLDDGSAGNLSIDTDWFGPNMDSAERTIGVVHHAVPFVRTYPDAPVPALYGQVASSGGINLNLDRPWADLKLAERIAWTVFRDTLVTIDRLMAAEPKPAGEAQDIHRVPIDETTMERVDDPLQLAELAGGPL